jgi:uncharacterized protein YciI
MSLFAVTRKAGTAWAAGGIFDQPALDEHASFMNTLADEGFLRLAGPLAQTEKGHARVLLIVEAESEAEIHRRLAPDPWTQAGLLVITGIEEWNVIVGGERLAPHRVSTS